MPANKDRSPENDDEIDEFIKKHLEDDDEDQQHEKLTSKAKEMLGSHEVAEGEDKESQDMLEESLSDSEVSGSFDSEQLTPKQSLLNGLIRLGVKVSVAAFGQFF